MSAEQVFSIANGIALAGWLMLLFAGGRGRSVALRVTGAIIPLLFAVLYTGLLFTHWHTAEGGFTSLKDVKLLFANEWLLLAGWVHYLAFDLFVGSWQVRDARQCQIPHWMLAPSLVLTFLFGPAGLLVYFLMRTLRLRGTQLQ